MTLQQIEPMSLTTPAGDAVRAKYRREGATAERERIIILLTDKFAKTNLMAEIIAVIKGESK